MANFKEFERALSSRVRNALNRTLTKISKEQRALLTAKLNVKNKYLHKRRLTPYRATQNDLIIKITSTPKKITPLMLENSHRPRGTDYGIPKGRHFYVRGVRRGVLNTGNTHGFNAVLASDKKIKRPFYYLDGLKRLDDEALALIDELKAKAQDIFTQELER